jgi:hypothetical protein
MPVPANWALARLERRVLLVVERASTLKRCLLMSPKPIGRV